MPGFHTEDFVCSTHVWDLYIYIYKCRLTTCALTYTTTKQKWDWERSQLVQQTCFLQLFDHWVCLAEHTVATLIIVYRRTRRILHCPLSLSYCKFRIFVPLNHNSMNISHVRQVFVHTTIIRDILACTRTLTLQNLNLCSSVLTWCDRNLLTKMASYHFQVNLKFVLRYICIYTSNGLQVIEPFLSAYMNFSGELP